MEYEDVVWLIFNNQNRLRRFLVVHGNLNFFFCSYGDKYAVSPVARIFTVLWMLVGLVTQSLFVATVTTSLVSKSLDTDYKLYGNKVAGL